VLINSTTILDATKVSEVDGTSAFVHIDPFGWFLSTSVISNEAIIDH
jgi:hypothetical protein